MKEGLAESVLLRGAPRRDGRLQPSAQPRQRVVGVLRRVQQRRRRRRAGGPRRVGGGGGRGEGEPPQPHPPRRALPPRQAVAPRHRVRRARRAAGPAPRGWHQRGGGVMLGGAGAGGGRRGGGAQVPPRVSTRTRRACTWSPAAP
jgi:hypothetical protein